jgi:dipeptidyl aminopeptidase/acylaminoacyl peptidase
MAASTLRLSFPCLGPDGDVYWLEGRPAEGGRTVPVRSRGGGPPEDCLPAPFDVRSRVHEYGGGAFTLGDAGELYFVNAADQAVHRMDPGRAPVCLSPGTPGWRFGDLVFDPHHRRLLAVAERRRPGTSEPDDVDDLIVALPLHPAADTGGQPGTPAAPTVLLEGADFYASPTPGPDGRQLAFLSWNHPHLPWDAAALQLADLDQGGHPTAVRHVAGDPAASAQQPVFADDGTLYFLWEPDGHWNLFRASPAGAAPQPIAPGPAEMGLPPWQLGTRTWGLLDPHTALIAEIREGVTRLVSVDLDRGLRTPLTAEVAAVAHLHAAGGRAAILASFADRPSAIVGLDRSGAPGPPLRSSSQLTLDPADVSHARPFAFATSGGEQAHGFFYPPRNRRAVGRPGERPPLLLLVHGGPTAATAAAYSPAVQFWTTRGFAVFDLNYRGSTGYGRPYRDRLRGHWGIFDVEDCQAAARALVAEGLVDERRLAIRGGSAGGFTVLAALCADDTFQAGCSLYGVSDLAALARDTHKFESRYCDALIGPWPERADLYAARSPLTHADRLSCPVIFFQGLDDRVVPPDQTERMAAALRDKGLPVEYHAFAGEQHGFRRADTIQAVYTAELAFYGRVFGFQPDIQPERPGLGR